MRSDPIERLVVQSRGMVINVIPPPNERSSAQSSKKGLFKRDASDGNKEADNFVETIYSANIFTQYYDNKLFRPYFLMMVLLGWKPFPIKRIIATEPGIIWKITNYIYPIAIWVIVVLGLVFKLITCYHDFPQIHPTLGQNSSQCIDVFYPGRSTNSSISYNLTSPASFESLYILKRLYFFGLSLPVRRNIILPLLVQELYNNGLPELLLLWLMINGYYLFRYKDWELVHTIMEMTFLKIQPPLAEEASDSSAGPSVSSHSSRDRKKIEIKKENDRRIKIFFDFKRIHVYTLTWLAMAAAVLTLRTIHIVSESGINSTPVENIRQRNFRIFIIVIIILSSFVCYIMLAVIFCTYLVLVQALLFMLRHTKERILNRHFDLESAKKELYRIKAWSEALNQEFAIPLALFTITNLLRILARGHMINRFWAYVQYSGQTFRRSVSVWLEEDWTRLNNSLDTNGIVGRDHSLILRDSGMGNGNHPDSNGTSMDTVLYYLPVLELVLSTVLYKMCLAYPLLKASQMGKAGHLEDYIGLEVAAKPYGFDTLPQSSIDSFLLFTKSLRLETRILFLKPQTTWFGFLILFTIVTVPLFYGIH